MTVGPVDVVLVDDAAEVRAVVKLHLEISGLFTVVGEGATGVEAIELAARLRPALMLLDVSMPEMDGLDALPGIHAASPSTRVVVLSGFSGGNLETAVRQRGAVGFLDKGLSLRELPERLVALLGTPPPLPSRPGPSGAVPDAADPDAAAVMADHLERFRTVFDRAAIGMATMTLAGTVVRSNGALAAVVSPGGDLIGRRYADLVSPDSAAAAVAAAVAEVAAGRRDAADVRHFIGPDGERYVHSTIAAVRDDGGRPLYLFVQVQDITDRSAAAAQLRASEERFRLLVESVQDYAIFMLDPDGMVSTWNLGAERMKGYRAEEIIGRHFRVFYPESAKESRHPERELELARRDGRYEEEGWRVRKDGTTFWANVLITALVDSDGRPVGFAKVTRDMTERRAAAQDRERAAADLARANVQLRAAAEQTAQFVALTAHELRSPIAAVTGAADILRSHWEALEPGERAESLDSILRGAGRLRRLLDDLLLVARLEARSFEFQVDDVPLAAVLKEAVSELAEEVRGITVSCPDSLTVRADRTRLVQIVTNLVANAARHGRPPIAIDARPSDPLVEIRVRDAGTGLSDEMAARAFDKFVRRPGGQDGGSGLGLFIVRELATGQGGQAWYERDAEGRSCFVFSLPRAAAR